MARKPLTDRSMTGGVRVTGGAMPGPDTKAKCLACDGWAVEWGVHPLTPCRACGGTGRPS